MVRLESQHRRSTVVATIAPATPRSSRWQTAARVTLAGPVTVLLSAMVFAGMPLWFPRGAAGVDHIVLPLILLPAIWAALFFYAVLDRSLVRVALVALVIGSVHGALLVSHFSTPAVTSKPQEAKQ
jgi:hypothetical protein